jgi:hypothetical protein
VAYVVVPWHAALATKFASVFVASLAGTVLATLAVQRVLLFATEALSGCPRGRRFRAPS